MTKLRKVCAAIALAAAASGSALAEVSANAGFMSDYIFRGVYQAEASAFGGLDIETESGFYMGTWGANLKDGLEYDLYLGYSGGGENFQWYAGMTGYYYTDDFDNSYEEVNLGFTSGFFTLDLAIGDYKVGDISVSGIPADRIANKQSYLYVGATFAPETGPYYFFGRTDYRNIDVNLAGVKRLHGTGADGYWFEIGKTWELIPDLELNVAALFSGDVPQSDSTTPSTIQLAPTVNFESGTFSHDSEYAVTVTLTKNISLMD